MEKISTISPQGTAQKEIRSPMVQKIHLYEQFLNTQVISLRKELKDMKNTYSVEALAILAQAKATEQNLILFREIFHAYLTQSTTDEKQE